MLTKSQKAAYMRAWWKAHPNYKKEWRETNGREKYNPETQRAYRERNAETLLPKKRKYAAEHRAEENARVKAWKRNNPEKHRQAVKRYRAAHPDKLREQRRRAYAANPERERKKAREWAARNMTPERYRANDLKRSYGMTPEQWDKRFKQQKHRCAICRRTDSGSRRSYRFHTDHCHMTKQTRGILCHHCNVMLGNAKDSIATLQAAIKYLKKWRATKCQKKQTIS